MKKLLYLICVFSVTLFAFQLSVSAEEKKDRKAGFLGKSVKEDVDAGADSLNFIGDNVVAKGNTVIRYKDFRITCDRAVVNVSTKDIEAAGNVVFIQRQSEDKEVDMWELQDLREDPNVRVTVNGYVTKATGKQMVDVTVISDSNVMMAERVFGNLSTGVLNFRDFACRADKYYCIAKTALRDPDGTVEIRDAKLSTCEYLMDGHEHYYVWVGLGYIWPQKERYIFFDRNDAGDFVLFDKKKTSNAQGDMTLYNADQGEHSIWAWNTVVNIMGVPLWVPFLYKPAEADSLGIQVQAGDTSDWGYFVKLSKTIRIMDDPNVTSKLMLDYYNDRGIGSGNETTIRTGTTFTQFFGYQIRDRKPYGTDDGKRDQFGLTESEFFKRTDRIETPKNRYDFRLSHMNHLTPRMDFRGHIEKISDPNFMNDYFEQRGEDDPQPVTFAALEYQFDRLSAAMYVRPRMNDFYTTVEALPEFRVDVPRQEIWKNIYYQGETSMGGYKMRWRDYDHRRVMGNRVDPKDYKAFRFDTLHAFYYPINLDWLNIIPRAAMRITYYDNSSKTPITNDDLGNMFAVDSLDAHPDVDVTNYDKRGDGKLRFAGELGLQMNTKIYRSWQNVKSPFWELDGLRHVMVPYINYTYIPKPTQNRNKLYYFDDIDRIEKQNFVRLGLKNRLQTRRGSYGNEQIYNWLSVENYFDFYLEDKKDFNHVGNLGTIVKFNPFEDLTFSTELLVDPGNSKHPSNKTKHSGIKGDFINKFSASVEYDNFIWKDVKLFASYDYQSAYRQRGAYSMASTLTSINSGTSFERTYGRNQSTTFGAEFPLPIPIGDGQWDDKTFISFDMTYDFEKAYMREKTIKFVRKLHCWEAALEFSQEIDKDHRGKKEKKNSVMIAFYLTAMPGAKISAKQNQKSGDGSSDSSDD